VYSKIGIPLAGREGLYNARGMKTKGREDQKKGRYIREKKNHKRRGKKKEESKGRTEPVCMAIIGHMHSGGDWEGTINCSGGRTGKVEGG